MKSEFSFKKEIKDKGYFFCAVTIEVKTIPGSQILLDFDKDSPWYSSVLFAANYFYESYRLENELGIDIKIIELNTHSVDTCNTVVLYVVLKSLLKTFNMTTNSLMITENGNLILPKVVNW
jgi:hypothetical protein